MACLVCLTAGYSLGWLQGYESRQQSRWADHVPVQIVQLFDEPFPSRQGEHRVARWLAILEQRRGIEWYRDGSVVLHQSIPGKSADPLPPL